MSIPPDSVLPTEVNDAGIAAGNTAGALSVSSDGDLVYDFPVWVPPGRNGIQPELSLNYRGRGANGLMGIGWTIGGLSQIARCAQTTAQNGANAPIAFDSTDRFCLDGQRLVVVAGNYGAGGAEYRTERDMFAKIVSAEADSLGPISFKVYLKNGRILYYGTTQDSRLEGQRFHSTPSVVGGAPTAQRGATTSWISETDHLQHIAYIGKDAHIYELYRGLNQPWSFDDLTAASGAPLARAGALTSWFSVKDNLQHIAYLDGNGNVEELYLAIGGGGTNWAFDEPTRISGAPKAQGGALTSWVSATDNLQHIAYMDGNGNVEELYLAIGGGGTNWAFDEPTRISGAPKAQGGALTSWVFSDESLQQMAYIDGNGHPDELLMHPGQEPWTSIDFTQGSTAILVDHSQTVRLTWALARIEDRYGNGINYSYLLQQNHTVDGEVAYELRPDGIVYTDTNDRSWPALKSVKFIYEPRPDVRTFYVSGLRLAFTSRLLRIEVNGPNPASSALIREYKLGYRNDSITQQSLLASLSECDGFHVCKAPLIFDWELGSMSFFDIDTGIHDDSSSNKNGPSEGRRFKRLTLADLNADGLDDLLYFMSDRGWHYRLNRGYKEVSKLANSDIFDSKHLALAFVLHPPAPIGADNARFVDMDRDGRSDLIVSSGDATGFETKIYMSPPFDANGVPVPPFSVLAFDQTTGGSIFHFINPNSYIADIDGNGFPDVLRGQNPLQWSANLNFGPVFALGTPGWKFGPQTPLTQASGQTNVFASNVDGDGTEALMLRNPAPSPPNCTGCAGIWYAATKSISGAVVAKNLSLVAGEVFPTGSWCDNGIRLFACFNDLFVDLNGDGLPDLISADSQKGGNPWISLNSGNGFHSRVEVHLASGVGGPSGEFPPDRPNAGLLIADLNGDGRQDFVFVGGQNGNTHPVALLASDVDFQLPFYLLDQNGNPLPLPDIPSDAVSPAQPPLAAIADINGDGLPDLIEVVKGELHVYLHLGNRPDAITKITEGMKETHTITWAPISNPDVHQRTVPACSFPTICQNSAAWVVSDVASDDGAGGTRHFDYQYQDARADALGRGWLGFAQKQMTDSATGMVSVTTFDNFTRKGTAYPFAYLPKSEVLSVTLDNGNQFSDRTTTEYQYASNQDNSIYSVFPCRTTKQKFDGAKQNSGPFLQVVTRVEYDQKDCFPTQTLLPFGNVTSASSITGDSYVTATARQYDNHSDIWLISMPTLETQTQTTPSNESTTRTTAYVYDTDTGAIVSEVIEPSGDASVNLTRTLSRDPNGLITTLTETSADQQRTIGIAYDSVEHAFPAILTNPLSQVEQFAYHPSFGALVAFEDLNNHLTRLQIDGFGRQRTELRPDSANITISYTSQSATGNTYRVSSRKAGGQEIESIVDQLGREMVHLTRGFDGRQILTEALYDSAGHLAQLTNPFFTNEVPAGSTSFTYDPLGRVRTTTYPDGSILEKTYAGLSSTVFDENRNQKTLDFDQLGHPLTLTEQASTTRQIQTNYAYGPFDVLESVTDPAGNVTRAQFDVRGRRKLLTDPDSGVQSTVWNAFDDAITVTNALGDRFQYTRDLLSRPVQINSKEGITSITWDGAVHGIGNIQQATSPDRITTAFAYDDLSRLSSETTQIRRQAYVFEYGYDDLGRLASIRYPSVNFPASPFKISFDYTPFGAIRAVNELTSGSPVLIWQNTARNAFDEITAEGFANGVATSGQFDLRGRPTSLITVLDGNPIQDLSYQYAANGNLTSRTNGVTHVVESYGYDPLDRLTQWDVNKNDRRDLTQQFDYDDIGNLASRTTLFGSGENLTYSYSGIHAGPHAVTSINNSTYTYDAAGRERTAPGRRSTYLSWGLPSRVVGKHFTDSFKYDFQQKRILKTRSDGTSVVTLDGLLESRSKGNQSGVEMYYIPALSRIVAVHRRHERAEQDNLYTHGDEIGSVTAITGARTPDPEVRAYDPFGTTREASDPSRPAPPYTSENLGFTERETDSEVGLLDMLGRLYDPEIGRFVSPDPFVGDPLASQSYNRYSYVSNNPLRFTDPTGFQCFAPGPGETSWLATPCSNPGEWEPYIPSLPAPPLLTGVDSPPTAPPLLSAGASDDAGLSPPPLVNAPDEGPAFRAPTPESDRYLFLQNLLHLNLPSEQFTLLGLNPATVTYYALYSSAKEAKDLFIPIKKFVTDQPDLAFVGPNGIRIYEDQAKLGFEAQKSIFSIGMMALPFVGPEISAETPLASVLEGHSAPQGFSGVFDASTSEVLIRPSTEAPVIPEGWVPRAGGHADVSAELGGDPASHHGFAVILQENGSLNITWRSRTLNAGPGNEVPIDLRQIIVDALKLATGRIVNF